MYSSDSEDNSDFEIVKMIFIRRKKTIRERTNHFTMYDDADFYFRYRMSKASVYSILQLIRSHIEHQTNWNSALTAEQMILITLRVYATGGMLRTIGDVYGVSESTVSRTIAKVSHHIALLRPNFIHFPTTQAEHKQASLEFYNFAKFPNVLGALDCTHVKIISPGGDSAELYRNRKGFFSINVQTICDANLKISDIVARWPGSAHDSNIFKNSRIYSRIESGEFDNGIIAADSGYKNSKYVLTPLLNPKTQEENLYNESIIRTRCCVERSYGVWKRRFPILSLGMRLNFRKVESIIVAAAVLHNICCINNELEVPNLSSEIDEAIEQNLSVPNNRTRGTIDAHNSTRSHLINHYFKNMRQN